MRRQWAGRAAVFALVVLGASLVPLPDGDGVPAGLDKLVHAAGYAAVAFAAAMAPEEDTDRALAGVVLAVTAFGAGVEVVQPTVGRTASLADALANLAGAAAGALAARVSRTR
jgi:VanZ family protein